MADDERDAVRRFTLLVLFQAQADRASELVISSSVVRLKYKVGETWHDLSPPPPHIIPQVMTELASLAGLQDRAFPAEGKIDIPLSGTHLRWKVQLSNTDAHCFAITPDNTPGHLPWS
jgi:type II secretory ATPase GspE/PulE/Tfp pilus assembly ATPase PilB-like protein